MSHTRHSDPEIPVSFNFAFLTREDHYNLSGFSQKKASGKEETELLELLDHMKMWSQSSLKQLETLGKYRDGFEVMKLESFRHPVADAFPVEVTPQREAAVFRFKDYRMICLFKDETEENVIIRPDVLYVIAFDWDYSLYDHGA